jgi:hypothetical protein
LRSPLIVRVDPDLVHVEELTRWKDARPNKNPSCKFAGVHLRRASKRTESPAARLQGGKQECSPAKEMRAPGAIGEERNSKTELISRCPRFGGHGTEGEI